MARKTERGRSRERPQKRKIADIETFLQNLSALRTAAVALGAEEHCKESFADAENAFRIASLHADRDGLDNARSVARKAEDWYRNAISITIIEERLRRVERMVKYLKENVDYRVHREILPSMREEWDRSIREIGERFTKSRIKSLSGEEFLSMALKTVEEIDIISTAIPHLPDEFFDIPIRIRKNKKPEEPYSLGSDPIPPNFTHSWAIDIKGFGSLKSTLAVAASISKSPTSVLALPLLPQTRTKQKSSKHWMNG